METAMETAVETHRPLLMEGLRRSVIMRPVEKTDCIKHEAAETVEEVFEYPLDLSGYYKPETNYATKK